MTQNPWGGQPGPDPWQHPRRAGDGAADPWAAPPQPAGPPRPGPQRFPQPSAQTYLGPAPAWGAPPQQPPPQPWGGAPQQPQPWQPPPAPQGPSGAAPQPAWRAPQPPGSHSSATAPYGTFSAPYAPRPPAWQQPAPGASFPAPTTQPLYPQPGPWAYPPAPAAPKRRSWVVGVVVGVIAFLVLFGIGALALRVLTPADDPTAGPSPGPTPTQKYANDDYQVPPPDPNPGQLPVPESDSQASQWIKQNKLYSQAVVAPIRCELADIDITTASNDELTQHVNDEVACLMRAWSIPVDGATFTLYRPTVTVYDGSINTGCGRAEDRNAFYCSGDQQIYYAQNVYETLPPELQRKRWMIEAVIAHEFGHAIQARTGILVSTHGLQKSVSKSDKNQLNRQLELQADCFAGTFLQSVQLSAKITPAELDSVKTMFGEIGDDVLSGNPDIDGDHGHGQNRAYWFSEGLHARTFAACNTYTAPSAQTL